MEVSFNLLLHLSSIPIGVSISMITLRDNFIKGVCGDVCCVVAVARIRLRESVHVQQLPVGHLPVGVKYLLAFTDGAHTHHLQTVLKERERERRGCEERKCTLGN